MPNHKNAHDDLSPDFLREILDYSPKTGHLRWKVSRPPRGRIGAIAGTTCKADKNRIKLGIGGKEYYAHRIIWAWMTGTWPKKEVDHKNEIRSDNRWINLREATPSENHRNRGLQKNNKSGYKGVCWDNKRKRWVAWVVLNQKQHWAGVAFRTKEDAAKARATLAKKLHGTWAKEHHQRP